MEEAIAYEAARDANPGKVKGTVVHDVLLDTRYSRSQYSQTELGAYNTLNLHQGMALANQCAHGGNVLLPLG